MRLPALHTARGEAVARVTTERPAPLRQTAAACYPGNYATTEVSAILLSTGTPALLLLFLLSLRQASVVRQQTRTVVADEFQVLDNILFVLYLLDLLIDKIPQYAKSEVIIFLTPLVSSK